MPHPYTKVALITGANRGIGAATALALAQRGVRVVLTARAAGKCQEVMERISAIGGETRSTVCDVTSHRSVHAVIEQIQDTEGRLDIVVNNAGQIDPIALLHETDPAVWTRNLHTNLLGPYHVLHATLPLLQRSGQAAVINISTGAAHTTRRAWSAYCSAKAGLAMLTRCIANEYQDHGVYVYGLQPGLVDTGMQAVIRDSGANEISRIPQSDLDPPEKSAQVIAWLADRRPQDLIGQDLSVHDAHLQLRAQSEPA